MQAMQQGESLPQGPRSWKKGADGSIICFRSNKGGCVVVSLRTAAQSVFYDADLETATKEINAILDRLVAKNGDTSRHLSFIDTGDGLLLAWSNHEVSAFDDHETIAEALGLHPREA